MDSSPQSKDIPPAPPRTWAQRRIFRELSDALSAVRQEIRRLPSQSVDGDRLRTFEEQLDRLAHLLEHVEDVERTRLEIHLITQVALSLSNALDLDEVLALILDSVKQVVDYDAAGIFVLDEGGRVVVGEILRGYDTFASGKVRQKLGRGLMGWAMEHMAPVVVADVARDPRYVNARPQTRSELAMPLFTGGKVVGCFNLESDSLGTFTGRDADRLMTFASHAAVAIERARMHREILAKQRMEEELALARRMQLSLLPRSAPEVENFDLAGVNTPSEMVGGDYFDYIRLTNKDLGLVISDVAGKGVPAAFIMASLRASLRIEAVAHYSISTILYRVNNFLYESVEPERFVTAFYGVLDVPARHLTYSNAGHNPPLLLRRDGRRELLTEGGLILGAFPGAAYRESVVTFSPGDMLVLYTDGVTEAESPEGEQFGLDRLEEAAREVASRGARAVTSNLVRAVQRHAGQSNLQDDLTLMVIRCR
ncbi:MAG: GAF domain-containing protein [Candidatus Zixiibacteriota bacterium]|nr:MAG: GAF domain-containing protein [candidate division Zixibacteria bacterium]